MPKTAPRRTGAVAIAGNFRNLSRRPMPLPRRRVDTSRRRRDIDGLRAIAVTLVVLFHSGVSWLPGGFIGVDVFFVISGFLISGMLVDRAVAGNPISLREFYSRRIRRLLAAATVVLLSVVVLSWLILPKAMLSSVGVDVQSAATFVSNWNFALQSSDYWSSGVEKSPVLHFWSLSVEEQFYVVWPLLLLGLMWVAQRWLVSVGKRRIAGIGISAIFVVSLSCSILMSSGSPDWSYFGLHTRAWELAAGALVWFAVPHLRALRPEASRWMTWTGLAGILLSAIWLTSATVYPGYAALLPVLSTCLVLAAGSNPRIAGEQSALLSTRVAQSIGGVSYSWYLWHWPLLIFAGVLFTTSRNDVAGSPVGGVDGWVVVLTVSLSLALAYLTKHFIEDPARFSQFLRASTRWTLGLGAAMVLVVVLIAGQLVSPPEISTSNEDAAIDQKVAEIHTTPALFPPGQAMELHDDPYRAKAARAELPVGCSGPHPGDNVEECNIGASAGTKSVVLVGDSQALAWSTGFGRAARKLDWKLYAFAQPACPIASLSGDAWNSENCQQFRSSSLARIAQLPHVDRIFVARSRVYSNAMSDDSFRSAWYAGFKALLTTLGTDLAKKVVVIRDAPVAPSYPTVPDCVADVDDLSDCDFPKELGDWPQTDAENAAAADLGVSIDHFGVASMVCPTATCHAVDRFGTIIYRDELHISQRFSNSLWRVLSQNLGRYA